MKTKDKQMQQNREDRERDTSKVQNPSNRFLILMTMASFADLGLDTWLRKQLESVGIVEPSPIQVCTDVAPCLDSECCLLQFIVFHT